MALQPKDRQNAKHAMRTAQRAKPQLVNRSNKSVLVEITPTLQRLDTRFGNYAYGATYREFCGW